MTGGRLFVATYDCEWQQSWRVFQSEVCPAATLSSVEFRWYWRIEGIYWRNKGDEEEEEEEEKEWKEEKEKKEGVDKRIRKEMERRDGKTYVIRNEVKNR